MMTKNTHIASERFLLRDLSERDAVHLKSHFMRLDAQDRFLRFCGAVTDANVDALVDETDWSRSCLIGCFVDGVLRGVVQVSPDRWAACEAEFAISVDREFRRCGVASALMRRAVAVSRWRGFDQLTMTALPENQPIKELAAKTGFHLDHDHRQIVGRLTVNAAA